MTFNTTITTIGIALGAILALVSIVLCMDAMTAHPHYELEPAVVRKVVKNPSWGFIGQDEMTLVRFKDGYDTQIGGDRGEPGDVILVARQRGVDTIFGIFAHR